ncbi:hypothetical protein MKW94_003393 [Papaver nudicaule]|uniref:Pentatricopeptide repeat-containing protein n=1 Tax=Papaver nudicaule TaxID=74823 RepID=A0AA41V177_PAPNU|nr:hypothetical protein [Papaver nudicaule]
MKINFRKLVLNGLYKEALLHYTKLHSTNSIPGTFYFDYPSIFKACKKLNLVSTGVQIHTHVIKTGFNSDVFIATSVTDMYMKSGFFKGGAKMFDEMTDKNIASVNSVISGLSQNGYHSESLLVFKNVGIGGFKPNSVTLASVLPACERLKNGLEIHGLAVKFGFEMDIYVATALLTMYFNCKEFVSGLKVFKMIEDKSVVSYNALLSGFVQNGLPVFALKFFREMRQVLGESPSIVTSVSVLSACSDALNLRFGKQVHCLVFKYEMDCDVMVGTTLVDMYSKSGCWKDAYDIFKEMGDGRNLMTWNSMISGMMYNGKCEMAVELFEQLELFGLEPDSSSWNSMIGGFSRLGKGIEAFCFFKRMQLAGITPSLQSVTSLLSACSVLFALQSGREIHGHTIRTAIEVDEFISTSLIDMYMKCGFTSWARKVFDHSERSEDPAIWNAMISGYGTNGKNDAAHEIFDLMLKEGVIPNSCTFVGILSACSHTGNVAKGWEIFRIMNRNFGLKPNSEHFGCMVDLLGRDGRLDEAWNLINGISEPSSSVYASLLGACRLHLDADLGEKIVERLLELEPGDSSPLVILSNIYAGQGRWKEVERIRDIMSNKGLRKLPGCSLVEVTENSHQLSSI